MSIRIPIDLEYEFEVKSPYKTVFALLSNVPKSASFFPKLERLVDLGGDAYEWRMEKIGVADAYFQTVFANAYTNDAKQGRITWTALHNIGNAQLSGSWFLKAQKSAQNPSTWACLSLQGAADVPLPEWMSGIVVPFLNAEFEQMTDEYVARLIEHFGGEV